MTGRWAKDLQEEMNLTLAFVLDLGTAEDCELTVADASFFKIYADGHFLAFGPQRAAHGYAREAKYTLRAKTIIAEVMSLGVRTFHSVKQPPLHVNKTES